MDIKNMNIADLKPAKYNPRKDLKPGDREYEQLKKSIVAFGYVDPIIVNSRNNIVIGGHQRLKVLAELGHTTVDVSLVDLDESNEKALNVALNKISGEWDMPMLQDILFDLNTDGFDLDLIGFSLDDLTELGLSEDEGEASDDDFDIDKAVEDIQEPVSKPGDLYEFGNHRLLCGDSTKAEDVQRLMNGQRAGLICTDPPWNVAYGASQNHPSWKQRTILNDDMSTEQFHAFLLAAFTNMASVAEAGCMTYVFMSAQEWSTLMSVMQEAGFHWSSTVIWVKDSLVLSRKDYHTQYEPAWYGWVDGAARRCPLEDRKQSDVWEIPRPKRSDVHPTMKPLELIGRCITNSSRAGDNVLDLFGGSGSTLIASAQTGRNCYTMELDPKYADVIVNRYYQNFPENEIKLNGKPVNLELLFKSF